MFRTIPDYTTTVRNTGHTNCAKCIATYTAVNRSTRGTYPCPSCRNPFKAAQSHPIFLELVDSASQAAAAGSGRVCHPDSLHKQIASALQELTRVEEDQQRQTVQRAAREMEKVSEMMDTRDCLLVSTLSALGRVWANREICGCSTRCHMGRVGEYCDANLVIILVQYSQTVRPVLYRSSPGRSQHLAYMGTHASACMRYVCDCCA